MAKMPTKSELYDLIWTRPRALAKELGISDVAIGKPAPASLGA
jgi:hypothetical protein